MSVPAFDNAVAELQLRLQRTQRRLRRAALRRRLLRGLEPLLWVGCVLALLLALQNILGGLMAGVPAVSWPAYVLAVCVAIGIAVAAAIAPVMRLPGLRAAAERLDLATSDHNRIANALALARIKSTSSFAALAIDDGLAAVRRLEDRAPYAGRARVAPGRIAMLVVVFVGLNALALLDVSPPPGAGLDGTATAQAAVETAGVPAVPPTENGEKPAERHARPAPPRPLLATGDQSAAAGTSPSDLPPAGAELRLAAAPAPAPGEAEATATPAAAEGSGATSAAPTSDQRGSKPRGRTQKPPRPAKESETMPPSGDGNSSISSGGSGSGSATPVAHDWTQRDSAQGDEEGGDEDEPVEDEERTSTQRGGLQPSLKDRNAAPSRDLGLGDNLDGPPGTGRGGPTPPKKSRGTAALVLGVPIPDFVRGQLGPGTTKVIRQRVTPMPAPGNGTEPAAVPPRSVPEAPVRRFEVPGDVAGAVRAILLALHTETAPGEATAETTDSASPQREQKE